jgi:ketosteroid isomerase-like protein
MSEHPNVTLINRMTKAVFENDKDALSQVFADDLVFHVRGPLPCAGDHNGADGFLGALGTLFELTGGDVKLEQLFCVAQDGWAAEWERAVMGRKGRTLEAEDAFIYRFEAGRIAEIWMMWAPPAGSESFWD